VWAQAYGHSSSTTRRIAELLAERGDLEGAVSTWEFCDEVWQNPAGLRSEYLSTLSPEDYLQETTDDPEDWAFMEAEKLTLLLAEQGDEAATADLRSRAEGGDGVAARWLAQLPIKPDGSEDTA